MIFKMFDASEAESFGAVQAQDLLDHWARADSDNEKKQLEKQRKAIADTLSHVFQYAAANKLNFFKQAKLVNSFKWVLKDADFDERLIDSLARDVLVNLQAGTVVRKNGGQDGRAPVA